MKHIDKLKRAVLPVLAAVLVLGASAGSAGSYFTTYVTAQGGHELHLRDVHVDVEDTVVGTTKSITVSNTGEVPCYVRAKAIQASTNDVPIDYSGSDVGWFDGGDGYWYYSGIVEPGDTAPVLKAEIKLPTSSPERPIPEGTTFNVTVITECAKIFYDEAGNAKPNGPTYEGWTLKEG